MCPHCILEHTRMFITQVAPWLPVVALYVAVFISNIRGK